MPVVDASVVVDWVAPGRDSDGPAARVLRRLVELDLAVLGPALLLEEVSNALLTGIRHGRWDGAQADASFARLSRLPVDIDSSPDLAQAWELARRHDQHPVYDMVYVELAQRTGDVLITADERLASKAVASVVSVTSWLSASSRAGLSRARRPRRR